VGVVARRQIDIVHRMGAVQAGPIGVGLVADADERLCRIVDRRGDPVLAAIASSAARRRAAQPSSAAAISAEAAASSATPANDSIAPTLSSPFRRAASPSPRITVRIVVVLASATAPAPAAPASASALARVLK